jgi:hypothetical protein
MATVAYKQEQERSKGKRAKRIIRFKRRERKSEKN